MPLYEYKCEGCGEVFEVIQKFSDEPVTVHEKCGAPVRRLMSAPSFQLKGSGWYATDYAKSGSGAPKNEKSEKSESSKSSDSSAKVETKTSDSKPSESKPAASSDKSKGD